MDHYVTGGTIKRLREQKKLTQRQLAEQLCVSDKTISKWETCHGLPDISLLEPLAAALGVSVAELLSGACVVNHNRCGNLLRSRFYLCPVCGNLLWSAGAGAFSCCGISLPPQEPEAPDPDHTIRVEQVENEWYVSMAHPMEKGHFITFFALVTGDRVQIVKLYPEQNAETRFFVRGKGRLFACCNRHGLFELRL